MDARSGRERRSVCMCVYLRGTDRIGNFGPFSVTSSFHGMVFLACSRDTLEGVGESVTNVGRR